MLEVVAGVRSRSIPRNTVATPRTTVLSVWPATALVTLAVLTLAVAALGMVGLPGSPLSTDEAATRLYASTPRFAGLTEEGGNMVLYYLLMHLLVVKFGVGRLVLRLPSVVFGAATVPVVGEIGRRVANVRVALASAALFAISLPLITWEQAARGYTLGMFLVSVAVLSWFSLFRRPSFVRAAVYVGLTTLSVAALLVNWWVVVGEGLVWLVCRGVTRRGARVAVDEQGLSRDSMRWTGGALVAVVVLTVPLAYIALRAGMGSLVAARNRVTPARIGHTLLVLASGAGAGSMSKWEVAAAVLAGVTAVLWLAGTQGSMRPPRWSTLRVDRLFVVGTAAAWLAAPVLGQAAFGLLVHPMYQYRYFILCLPPAALLAALGLERFRRFGLAPYVAGVTVLLVARAVFMTHVWW